MTTTELNSEALPACDGSAHVVKPFVECPRCGKLWPYDGHAADVCCGGCSHNFYVPPDAKVRRLLECESVLRSNCVGVVGEQNASVMATAGSPSSL